MDSTKVKIAEYVEREVAKAPPLRQDQINVIARALRGEVVRDTPTPPSAYELEQRKRRDAHAASIKHAEELAASMMACDACNLPPVAHRAQSQHGGGVGFHEWVPGRAQRILKGER